MRVQAFRLCGSTTLLLNGTQTASVHERRSCCKNVDSVFLSLDDRKAELYWKTTVAFTRPFEGLVAQRPTRLTANQEMTGVRIIPSSEAVFLLPCFWCLRKQNKTTLSTDTRKTLLQPKEKSNQREHSLYFGDEP